VPSLRDSIPFFALSQGLRPGLTSLSPLRGWISCS